MEACRSSSIHNEVQNSGTVGGGGKRRTDPWLIGDGASARERPEPGAEESILGYSQNQEEP